MNLDVILKKNRFGFDACLMMSYAAAYEFHDIADYYIASEATEPGNFIFQTARTSKGNHINLIQKYYTNLLDSLIIC